LNWVFLEACSTRISQLIFGLALPLWLLLCAVVNVAARVLDALDNTAAFYDTVMVKAEKRSWRAAL